MQPILKINLTTGNIVQVSITNQWQIEYLGGASLAARLLYDTLVPSLSPFSPEAPLLFLNGPLTGTAGPAVGRFVVCGRSPATELWAESNCGGFWGPELRMAGFDGLWIEGKSEKPVYISIQDDQIEIREAAHIWGLDTYSTQAAVESDLGSGKRRVAVIGPAGEALIPFSLILTDHGRVAGRTGLGAVMGSKNLKAIAVQGHGKVPVANIERYKPLRSETSRALRSDAFSQVLRELGSSSAAEYFDYLGEMPKRYFQHSNFSDAYRISGGSLKESILSGVSACHACVIACGRVVKLEDGVNRKGPEYETLVGFGPNLLLSDPIFVTRMGELCDRYGMDTISLSNTIGLAFSLFDQGKIQPSDTGGISLNWGDAHVVEQLVHDTVHRERLGQFLAEGAQGLGRRFAAEEEAVVVNGLEVPYHDPRGASGMAIVYATSPRGACHNQSDYFLVDIGQVEQALGMQNFSRHDGAAKAKNVAIHQNWRTVFNSLVTCFFANLPPESVVDLINAACGVEWDIKEMLIAGERGWNLKRVINHRLGLTRQNDRLPKIFLTPFVDDYENKEVVPDFEAMLTAYYQARGWDLETGFPYPQTLNQIGLDWAVADLWAPLSKEESKLG